MISTIKYNIFEKHLLGILSFLAASFLWIYVVNSEPITIQKEYKIKILSPSGLAPDQLSTNTVELKLKGARAFLKALGNDELELTIDLSRKSIQTDQSYVHIFHEHDFPLPFGVSISQIMQENVTIVFDKLIKKKVPIKPAYVNELATDLQLIEAKLIPNTVMIEGPRGTMKNIASVKTTSIDLATLSGSGTFNVGIMSAGENITISQNKDVIFDYNVRPNKANFTLKKIEIKFITSNQRFKASKSMVSLDVLTREDRTLNAADVKVYAEIPDGKKGKIDVRLRAELPEGVHLLNINPPSVEVNIY